MSDPTNPSDESARRLPGEFEDSSAQRLAREMAESPAAKLAREMANLPTAKLAQQMAESPTAKLVREMASSPSAKLARELAESPAAKLAREIALADASVMVTAKNFAALKPVTIDPGIAEALAQIKPVTIDPGIAEALAQVKPVTIDPGIAEALAQIKPITIDPGIAEALAQIKPITIDPGIAEALAQIKPITIDPGIAEALAQIKPIEIAPGLAQAIGAAQRALADFGKPYGGLVEAVRTIEVQSRTFQTSLVASLGGAVGDAARINQWASSLGRIASADIDRLYPNLPTLASEIDRLRVSTMETLTGPSGVEQDRLSAMLGLGYAFSESVEATRLKMSAFAGVTDMFGAQSRVQAEAYRSLFGSWRTRPDLPESYWRDSRVRRRMYDAAEVDPGLAGLNLGVAVEVVVESGLTSGARSEANAVAVISFGDVSMTIRSRGTRGDAYKVLERFEEELRAYVTRKLSEQFGPDWFKHRASAVGGDAKRVRKQALERGESPMPLIHYTELGHLSSIILASNNWDEVFADTFINRAEFDHDMQKLIAARRPTMHIRPIDGLRLVELICVVQRLSRQMEDDGAWKNAAESER